MRATEFTSESTEMQDGIHVKVSNKFWQKVPGIDVDYDAEFDETSGIIYSFNKVIVKGLSSGSLLVDIEFMHDDQIQAMKTAGVTTVHDANRGVIELQDFVAEQNDDAPIDTRGMTFAELGQKRVTIYMGELTDAIGEFLDDKHVVVDQVGFDSIGTVHSSELMYLEDAHDAFAKFFNVSPLDNIGQGRDGFKFSVADLTPEQYAEALENTLRYFNFKK